MAGLSDTPEGGETRRNGDTVGVPHGEADGTLVENATVQPGDAVAINGGQIAQAAEGDIVVGVLVNYEVYGASHQGEKIKGDVDANVAVQGTYKARASANVAAGSALGAPDVTNGAAAGEFDDSGQTNSSDQGFRAIEVYNDGSQNWVEVRL